MVEGAIVVAVLLSVGTTASPTYTPSITPHPSPSPTESPTLPSRTPTNTPPSATRTPTKTRTPTCAPTGTPYCLPYGGNGCTPCATIRPGCYQRGCGLCRGTCTPRRTPTLTSTPRCGGTTCTRTQTPTLTLGPPSMTPGRTLTVTASETATPTVTPTIGAAATPMSFCVGDHDGDCVVQLDEVVTCVRTALEQSTSASAACDMDHSGAISIDELVRSVQHALFGCGRDTNEPQPGPQIAFQLTEGSLVTLPDGSEEPMEGSFLLSSCLSLNTFFAGRIEALRFFSDSLVIQRGCSEVGRVTVSTLYGGETPTYLFSEALIDGESVSLYGQGPYDQQFPLMPLDLSLTAGEYRLRVIAQPSEYRATGADLPLCYDWGFV